MLTVDGGQALPSGPFETGHRSLQTGLRSWVERQTRHPLGYVEQLYTFADRDRSASGAAGRVISISYLGLDARERPPPASACRLAELVSLFSRGRTGAAGRRLVRRAGSCRARGAGPQRRPRPQTRRARAERLRASLCRDRSRWNEELVLQRYELL